MLTEEMPMIHDADDLRELYTILRKRRKEFQKIDENSTAAELAYIIDWLEKHRQEVLD